MGDKIPPAGDEPGEAAVRVLGLVTVVAGVGALTGVGLPATTGLVGRVVAAAAVLRGVVLSYVAPHPRTVVGRVRDAAPVDG